MSLCSARAVLAWLLCACAGPVPVWTGLRKIKPDFVTFKFVCQRWKFDTPGSLCCLCALAALLQNCIIRSLASNVALLLEIQRNEHPILVALRALYDLFNREARKSNSFFMLVYSSAYLLVFSFRNLGSYLYFYTYFLLNKNEMSQYIHSHICLRGLHRVISISTLLSHQTPNHRNVSRPFLPHTEAIINSADSYSGRYPIRFSVRTLTNLHILFIILLKPAIKCCDSPFRWFTAVSFQLYCNSLCLMIRCFDTTVL